VSPLAVEQEQRVRDVLAKVLEQDPGSIDDSTEQSHVPEWDSLRHLELVMALEHEFGVSFSMETVPELTSFVAIKRALEEGLG
jgi:acyl carrier protein